MADNQQEPGKMFVGGLKWETNEESLRTYFTQFGQLSSCTVMMDHNTGRPRGFGFVTFVNPDDTKKVMAQPNHTLDGKKIDPKPATNNTKDKGKCKVFLGGMSPEATDDEIKAVFCQFGAVDSVDHKTDGAGRGRGFAFLTFENEESAAKAVQEHFVAVRDKNVEVKVADPANRKGSGMGGQRHAEYNGFASNGQAFPDPQAQQSRGGYYNQYGASGYYPQQQYSYPPQAYNGSSGAGYNMHTGAANGQAMNYGEYGYPNSRDASGFGAPQQQYASYHHHQQGHYGGNQAQGYGRSQPYNNYPVHQ